MIEVQCLLELSGTVGLHALVASSIPLVDYFHFLVNMFHLAQQQPEVTDRLKKLTCQLVLFCVKAQGLDE